ncbi:hypothetical protein [Edaphobacter bradus]|uniref:hypothetical protein n=1 Tax=Edaphobacter bradus TaxID=2259016 RepID=UPI0021E060C0|nr:hypothetical protein [Edaphobacter bradus]
MYIPLTMAALALLTTAMIVLRFFWWHLPERLQTLLIGAGVTLTLLRVLFAATQWSMTSGRMNALLNWAAAAGFEIVLVRFSLMRPQWLTVLCALILLTPTFGSSLLMPLTLLFEPQPAEISSIGGPYMSERIAWEVWGDQNSGFDVMVYYKPPFAPFLHHLVQRFAFNTVQCDAAKSSAIADPNAKTVQFICPGHPGQQTLERTLPMHMRNTDKFK